MENYVKFIFKNYFFKFLLFLLIFFIDIITPVVSSTPSRHKTSSRHLRIVLELSCLDKTFSKYLQDIFM